MMRTRLAIFGFIGGAAAIVVGTLCSFPPNEMLTHTVWLGAAYLVLSAMVLAKARFDTAGAVLGLAGAAALLRVAWPHPVVALEMCGAVLFLCCLIMLKEEPSA